MAYIYKRKNKNGKLLSEYYYIGYTDRGEQKQVSSKCKKRGDAIDVMNRIYVPIEQNNRHGTNLFEVQMKFFEALDFFEEKELIRNKNNRSVDKAKKSIIVDTWAINQFKKWCTDNDFTEFHEINISTINDYIDYLKSCDKKKNTIHRQMRVVKTFFKWCTKKNYININPFDSEEYNKTSNDNSIRHQYLSSEELQTVFDHCKGIYKDIVRMLYYTGLRIGELLLLEWQDYNGSILRLRIQDGAKTKKLHNIVLNDKAKEILDRIKNGKIGGSSEDKIFNIEYQNIVYYLKKVYKNLNLSIRQPLHIFRHTAASHLSINDVSILVIKEFLRHSTLDQSLIYASLSPKNLKTASDLLNLLG